MPFTVEPSGEPSGQVVIDKTTAGPDDFLELTLEDGSRLYARLSAGTWHRSPHLTFDESMLPAGFVDFSRQQAADVLRRTRSYNYGPLEQWYEQRQVEHRDIALPDYIALRLRRDVSIVGSHGEEVNIGTRPTVWLSDRSLWRDAVHPSSSWAFPAPIIRITPVSRIEALVQDAIASVRPQPVDAENDGDGIED